MRNIADNVAIIAAAGWKGAGADFPGVPPGCPEALLPLGDGTTILSRQVRQLRERGFEPFIGVGQPGCRFPWWARHVVEGNYVSKEGAEQGSVSSPWTEERVEYVRGLGTPVLCPDPDATSHHGTYRLVLDAAGWDWGRAFFSHGDMLISDGLLDDFLALPWPCHIVFRLHTWLILDPQAARVYCYDITQHSRAARMWDARKNPWTDILHAVAPLVNGDEVFPGRADEFMDVDIARDYGQVLEWAR